MHNLSLPRKLMFAFFILLALMLLNSVVIISLAQDSPEAAMKEPAATAAPQTRAIPLFITGVSIVCGLLLSIAVTRSICAPLARILESLTERADRLPAGPEREDMRTGVDALRRFLT